MKVLVTGAGGRLGGAVIRALRERGDETIAVDLCGGDRQVDIRDPGQVLGVAAGCDALIHCAAVPSPEQHAAEVVFRTNVMGTFNALRAAELAGIERVAIASSLSVMGGAWANPPHPPRYAPVDEAHPHEVEDPYGLSKVINERTAEMFARRSGMAVAALRFGWILSAGEARAEAEQFEADPLRNRASLWGYIDDRDAAAACLAAIEAPPFGYDAFAIIGGDTLATIPTAEALARYAPGVEIRVTIRGYDSPFSTDRARDIIGWTPVHSWRNQAGY
jgi:nucleoside-diphosphate-sugar epimerase